MLYGIRQTTENIIVIFIFAQRYRRSKAKIVYFLMTIHSLIAHYLKMSFTLGPTTYTHHHHLFLPLRSSLSLPLCRTSIYSGRGNQDNASLYILLLLLLLQHQKESTTIKAHTRRRPNRMYIWSGWENTQRRTHTHRKRTVLHKCNNLVLPYTFFCCFSSLLGFFVIFHIFTFLLTDSVRWAPSLSLASHSVNVRYVHT